jgi:hypothetical protein
MCRGDGGRDERADARGKSTTRQAGAGLVDSETGVHCLRSVVY